jgi:hypothetical protein
MWPMASSPGGSIRTTFVLLNTGADKVTVRIGLTGDDGSRMQITMAELGTEPVTASAAKVRVAGASTAVCSGDAARQSGPYTFSQR